MDERLNFSFPHILERQASLTETLEILEKTCKSCNPLTPVTCVVGCKTWKLKNQFRNLHEKTRSPSFMTSLLNTLKNKRRIQLLELLSKEHLSTTHLQQRLKESGFDHSQKTMMDEYLQPLIEVGLVETYQKLFYSTVFGSKVGDLVRNFSDLGDILPPHSECYEEITLNMLLHGPKTCENLRSVIAPKSVARVLSRLQKAKLTETNLEKDYVFFFRTKRNPDKSELSPTESRVYNEILEEGISSRKLAEKAEISLRRTYKYLRKLKGKKLAFTRKKPTCYRLTAKGMQMAIMLEALRNLAAEALTTTERFVNGKNLVQVLPDALPRRRKRKPEQMVPLTDIQYLNHN